MMISIQLNIWKRLITRQFPPSSMYLLSPMPFYAKPHLKFPNFCIQIAAPFTTPNFCTQIATPSTTLDRGVIAEFLINRCGLTVEDITKESKRYTRLLDAKSSQNFEETLELLKGCGLTAPAQIRRIVLRNPKFLCCSSEINVQSKLTLLRTFMKEEDISKLVNTDSNIFSSSEVRIKSGISLLQRLGVEGEVLSELLGRQPRLLNTSHERVIASFKRAEDLGLNKGSKLFSCTLRSILGVTKENFERRLKFLSSLGIAEILRRWPPILAYSEEKMKLKVDFLINVVGIPLHYLVTYPSLFGYSLEKRIIPRFRVMEALKSMQVLNTEMISPCTFQLTEKCFLKKYVNENANSSILRDIYHRGKVEKLLIKNLNCL